MIISIILDAIYWWHKGWKYPSFGALNGQNQGWQYPKLRWYILMKTGMTTSIVTDAALY